MDATIWQGCRSELEKIALPRYEREIQAGNIQRSDIIPGALNVKGGILGPSARSLTRNALAAPAAVAPEALAQKRELNQRLYNAQVAAPVQAHGIPGLASVHADMVPGAGPATAPGKTLAGNFVSQVHSPPNAGQFIRGASRGTVGSLGAIASSLPQAAPYQKHLLPDAAPVDATLNKAVLQHELGEASEMSRPTVRPFASHLGPEPILRENLATQGDPEAIAAMSKVRKMNPDDNLVQKAIRRVGGTPDSPVPIGGKQHRAIEQMLDQGAQKLSPASRTRGLQLGAALEKQVPYVPEHVAQGVPAIAQHVKEMVQQPPKTLQGAWSAGKGLLQKIAPVRRFIHKGV